MFLNRLVIVLAICFLSVSSWAQEAKQTTIVILPIQSFGAGGGGEIASGMATAIAVDLARIEGIRVIPPEEAARYLADEGVSGRIGPAEMERLAQGFGARYLLTGNYLSVGGKFRLDMQVVELGTSDVRLLETVQGAEERFIDLLGDLSGRLVGWFGGVSPVKGGEMEIITEPPGAQVFLGDEIIGISPLSRKEMAAGEYVVRAELFGYQPLEETLAVKDREKTRRSWTLKRQNGGIRLWWKSKVDSEVRLGDERILIPDGSRYSKNLPAGEYEVETRMPYTDESKWERNKAWRTYTATVTVEPEQVIDILIDNGFFDPGIRVSRCSECEEGWDWGTKLVWYEK